MSDLICISFQASDQPFNLDKDEMESRIKERITSGELQYLDAALIISLIHRFLPSYYICRQAFLDIPTLQGTIYEFKFLSA